MAYHARGTDTLGDRVRAVPAAPLLTLKQVYGVMTYYLAYREAIEAYLQEQTAAFEMLKETLRRNNPYMAQRIVEIKHQRQTARR